MLLLVNLSPLPFTAARPLALGALCSHAALPFGFALVVSPVL
jgi:hypothetical protein